MRRLLTVIALVCLLAPGLAAQVGPSPWPKIQFVSSTGAPLAAGCVFTYTTGTNTPLATFTDSTGGTPNANPIILDAAGRADMWLTNGSTYRIKLVSAGGVSCASGVQQFQVDGITNASVTALLASNNTWTGTNAFNNNVTISGSLSLGTLTISGATTLNGTTSITGTYSTTNTGAHSGTETFTGNNTQKSMDNVKFVDAANAAGWAGAEPGAWLNAAIAAAGSTGKVQVAPGNYTATTTVAIPASFYIEMPAGVVWASSASPNFSLGASAALVGGGPTSTVIQNTGTGVSVAVSAASNFAQVRNLQLAGFGSSTDAITLGDNLRDVELANLRLTPIGRCVVQLVGANGTIFTNLHEIFCNNTGAGGSPAFQFDNTGGGGTWEVFNQVYAVSIGGTGIGFNVANGSATFIRTSTDNSVIGYQFGTVGTQTYVTMENADAEADSNTGISIVGPGDYTIKQQHCGTDASCITIASANAHGTIIDPVSQGTTGANDITATAASTGSWTITGGAGLSKLIAFTAPASYAQSNLGKLSAGGSAASGSTVGDITAQRSSTTGVYYMGGDGVVFLFRNGSTSVQLGGASFLPSGAFDLGSTALPWANLWLGTAATNNFKFQPAATAAARTVSIPDPLTNVNLAFNLSATSAAFATATTAATCVQNTTAVAGAATTMVAEASPVSTPGVGAVWSAFVSSAGNVTINECAVAASAGGSIAFNIRVHP